MATTARATVDDVLRLARDGKRFELIDGALVAMTPTGFRHGDVEGYLTWLFRGHADEFDLGRVVAGEVLFQLDAEARLARAADVAFIRNDRLPDVDDDANVFRGAPDLAVEIVSPGDVPRDVTRKVDDWLTHGTLAVLIVYPEDRHVVLSRDGRTVVLRGDDEVDLHPILAKFRCRARDLFPKPRKSPRL